MLTDYVRDHAYTIGWFGLMGMVWFGWAMEAPPKRWYPWLGTGIGLGIALFGVFGSATGLRWAEGGALDDNWLPFAILVGAEVIGCAVVAIALYRRRQKRWVAWGIAIVIALHFGPLGVILGDPSLFALTVVQLVGLVAVLPRLRRSDSTTSTWTGAVMGATLLAYAAISVVVFLARHGSPWPLG
ncbi:MAG: hypothetical protein ACTH31_00985 [Pseudoclavibacter sp.]